MLTGAKAGCKLLTSLVDSWEDWQVPSAGHDTRATTIAKPQCVQCVPCTVLPIITVACQTLTQHWVLLLGCSVISHSKPGGEGLDWGL